MPKLSQERTHRHIRREAVAVDRHNSTTATRCRVDISRWGKRRRRADNRIGRCRRAAGRPAGGEVEAATSEDTKVAICNDNRHTPARNAAAIRPLAWHGEGHAIVAAAVGVRACIEPVTRITTHLAVQRTKIEIDFAVRREAAAANPHRRSSIAGTRRDVNGSIRRIGEEVELCARFDIEVVGSNENDNLTRFNVVTIGPFVGHIEGKAIVAQTISRGRTIDLHTIIITHGGSHRQPSQIGSHPCICREATTADRNPRPRAATARRNPRRRVAAADRRTSHLKDCAGFDAKVLGCHQQHKLSWFDGRAIGPCAGDGEVHRIATTVVGGCRGAHLGACSCFRTCLDYTSQIEVHGCVSWEAATRNPYLGSGRPLAWNDVSIRLEARRRGCRRRTNLLPPHFDACAARAFVILNPHALVTIQINFGAVSIVGAVVAPFIYDAVIANPHAHAIVGLCIEAVARIIKVYPACPACREVIIGDT